MVRCLSAQVKGVVRSDKGEPLVGAMVKAVDADGGVLAYAIADGEGRYTLQADALPEPLRLVFSCMGYETLERTVDDLAQLVDVRLREKAFELKELVVRVPPVRALGDTLLYDVAGLTIFVGGGGLVLSILITTVSASDLFPALSMV